VKVSFVTNPYIEQYQVVAGEVIEDDDEVATIE